jgi:hypothetical protein
MKSSITDISELILSFDITLSTDVSGEHVAKQETSVKAGGLFFHPEDGGYMCP